jgi:hypothetical protein
LTHTWNVVALLEDVVDGQRAGLYGAAV